MLLCCARAIFSNDNAAKLVLQIRFKQDDSGDKGDGGEEVQDDDIFLKKVEENLLNTMELRGIKGQRQQNSSTSFTSQLTLSSSPEHQSTVPFTDRLPLPLCFPLCVSCPATQSVSAFHDSRAFHTHCSRPP